MDALRQVEPSSPILLCSKSVDYVPILAGGEEPNLQGLKPHEA